MPEAKRIVSPQESDQQCPKAVQFSKIKTSKCPGDFDNQKVAADLTESSINKRFRNEC